MFHNRGTVGRRSEFASAVCYTALTLPGARRSQNTPGGIIPKFTPHLTNTDLGEFCQTVCGLNTIQRRGRRQDVSALLSPLQESVFVHIVTHFSANNAREIEGICGRWVSVRVAGFSLIKGHSWAEVEVCAIF